MTPTDLSEPRQRNAMLRAEAAKAGDAFRVAAKGHAEALRGAVAVVDMSRSRRCRWPWAALLRKARVYQLWCDRGHLLNQTAQSMLAEDALEAGFDIHPAFVLQWQKTLADKPGSELPLRSDCHPPSVWRRLEQKDELDGSA